MKVGFTGTQLGCTQAQKAALRTLMDSMPISEFHHGDCIGADAQAHYLALNRTRVLIHPSIHNEKRAFCKGWITHEPKPPLDRNRVIVDSTDVLIGCPKSEDEELRSGTWATIRYARKKDKPVILVLPDGRVER